MIMQLGDLQCWNFTLGLVWAQLQFKQVRKYVERDLYILYTTERSLAGQRRDLHVKGDGRDSCQKTCQWDFIFPIDQGPGRRLQRSKYNPEMPGRTSNPLLDHYDVGVLLVEGCLLCTEVILLQEKRLQVPELCHVYAATVNQCYFVLFLLRGVM